MSAQRPIDESSLDTIGPLRVGVDLARVRRRANARLGSGIDSQVVRKMMSKLDTATTKEKKRL
jgi:hypothetical protein